MWASKEAGFCIRGRSVFGGCCSRIRCGRAARPLRSARLRRARSCAAGLRALRAVSPAREQVAADAEFLGDLVDRLASAQKLNGLRLELGGVSFAGCSVHGSSIL